MNINDVKKMSKAERLQAMETLWDSLLYENGEIETPEWHEKVLTERKKRIENGRAEFISLSDLKKSQRR
ncbi:MAG: addiction module protein [Desulfobacterales bacterium]